jgi:ATP sulfurylase
MGISGKVSHDPTLTRKYNALLEMLGVEGVLHQIEQYMDDSDLESIIKYIENETLPKPIFKDVDGNELHVGDWVVMLDNNGLQQPPPRGSVLVIEELYELTKCISAGGGRYLPHRVLKVSRN